MIDKVIQEWLTVANLKHINFYNLQKYVDINVRFIYNMKNFTY